MSNLQKSLHGQRLAAIQQLKSQDFSAARAAFQDLAATTGLGSDLRWRAMSLLLCGEYADALIDFHAVLSKYADCAFSHLAIASIRATCPNEQLRNGHIAVRHAKLAMEQIQEPTWRTYSVLAAAFAEDGDFDQAVYYAEQAKDVCPAQFRDRAVRRMTDYTLGLASTTSLADLREGMGFLQYACQVCGQQAYMVWMGEDAHVERLCSQCMESPEQE